MALAGSSRIVRGGDVLESIARGELELRELEEQLEVLRPPDQLGARRGQPPRKPAGRADLVPSSCAGRPRERRDRRARGPRRAPGPARGALGESAGDREDRGSWIRKIHDQAQDVLYSAPCDVAAARALVEEVQEALRAPCRRQSIEGGMRREHHEHLPRPSCGGSVVDGYCDRCGHKERSSPAAPSVRNGQASTSPSAPRATATGACRRQGCDGRVIDGYCDRCGLAGELPAGGSATTAAPVVLTASQPIASRATADIDAGRAGRASTGAPASAGQARAVAISAPGSSRCLRGAAGSPLRGAGQPRGTRAQAVLRPLRRARRPEPGGRAGRHRGLLHPLRRAATRSRPSSGPATSSPASTWWRAASRTAGWGGSTWPRTGTSRTRWVVLKGLLDSRG